MSQKAIVRYLCQTMSYPFIYLYKYTFLEISSFPSLLCLTCARSLVYKSIYVKKQICSTIDSLWMNIFAHKSQVFHLHFGNDLLCLLCFLQSQEDNQRTKDMFFFRKNACIFFGCQRITLVDNFASLVH